MPVQLRVLRWPHPFNYSAINNFAAAQARDFPAELLGAAPVRRAGDAAAAASHDEL